MTEPEIPKGSLIPGDFAPLGTLDEYAAYFRQLQRVFRKLTDFYRSETRDLKGEHYETAEISGFLAKLLHTAEALRVKYTYDPTHKLRVDLTESGFFNSIELENLRTDFRNRENRLDKLPELIAIKREMLDYMFRYRTEPSELLHKACLRYYFEMMDEAKLFFPFTPGNSLYRKADRGEYRTYDFSWANFDFATNRPFIHIMRFQQDMDRPPLEERLSNYDQFVEVIRSEGSRAPEIGVLALGIDGAMKEIHPEILKRTGIGPICTRQFSRDPENLFLLLTEYAEDEEDFILLFEDEIVFSIDRQVSKSMFSSGRVRETFFIPETDPECYRRKASMIHHYMMLPHTVLQHMDFAGEDGRYRNYRAITYDRKGRLYVG